MTDSVGGRLRGRVALLTGAAHGIGAAIATRFVAEGARVLLSDIDDVAGSTLARNLGDAAAFVVLDVRNQEHWARAVDMSVLVFGSSPNLLVHNAGVMVAGTVEDADPVEFHRAFEVNVMGAVLGTAACVPGMKEAGGGAVIVMSSIAALTGGAGFAPYAISKAGNATFARLAANELGQYGIRVNCLQPGGVESAMSTGPQFSSLDHGAWFGRMPIPRIGRADEIADAALYLACDESSFVTGATLVVDGGQTLGPSRTAQPAGATDHA
jgi:3alpha(or 20beta)-hydroxysteroid dehydrogenase